MQIGSGFLKNTVTYEESGRLIGKQKPFIMKKLNLLLLLILSLSLFSSRLNACSTFKLQKGSRLVYGHNLNEGDMGVPGLLFINKRGTYKTGRSWSEIITLEEKNPSSFTWISRYGSVTFNNFGRDLPDGGMNEAGLFIWEMNEDAAYPNDKDLPLLNQMSWMQYILDNCASTEEALHCAGEFAIDGWGWHFFIGDREGHTAAVSFRDGKAVVYTGEDMPVPALFNTPYDRELELLRYFRGTGGDYEADIRDPKVPRFVRARQMMETYDPGTDPVEYGLQMLADLRVDDDPEWSVLFNVRTGKVYFRTRLNPAVKELSLTDTDFTAVSPVLVMDMDQAKGGDVRSRLVPYTAQLMSDFTKKKFLPLLPEDFFTMGGLTTDMYRERIASLADRAALEEKQFFRGEWSNLKTKEKDELPVTIRLLGSGEYIRAEISLSPEGSSWYPAGHLQMRDREIRFTYRSKSNSILEVLAVVRDDKMEVRLRGIEDEFGSYSLSRI